ncbi:MAG: hypothetical protein IPP66_19725 [Anaerolineales bacterium]|nr:hypothetical protein [Anaerolineales bacterium]
MFYDRLQGIKYAPIHLQDEGRLVVPPAFATRWRDLGVRCNVRSRLPYNKPKLVPAEAMGEGDFSVCPVVSHRPTTF